jgi:hypothetical protein
MLLLVTARAHADDDNFQEFLFGVCTAPVGALAQRCGETLAGTGDVSPASESSLNPSQFLSGTSTSLASAYGNGEDIRSAGGPSDDDLSSTTAHIDVGPFGVSLNARWLDERFAGGNGGARAYDLDKRSAQLGIDYAFTPRTAMGLWLNVDDARLQFDGDGNLQAELSDTGEVETRGQGVALFASFSGQRGHQLSLGLGITENDYEFARRAVFEPINPMVTDPAATLLETAAQTTGKDEWLSVNWSRPLDLADWNVEPFTGLTWTRSEISGYSEQDLSQSGLAMRTDGVEETSLAGIVGLVARRVVSTGFAVLVPQLRAGYSWEFESDPATASSRFLLDDSDSVLVIRDQAPDRDALEFGAGLVAVFPRGWSLFLDARTTIGLLNRDRYVISLGWRAEL